MPRISEFYGIVIYMYRNDHAPPHFHAMYAEASAVISIERGGVLFGDLPVRARRLVREWSALHRAELLTNWELARSQRPLNRIDPLP